MDGVRADELDKGFELTIKNNDATDEGDTSRIVSRLSLGSCLKGLLSDLKS